MKRWGLLLLCLVCAACGTKAPAGGGAAPGPGDAKAKEAGEAAQPPMDMELRRWGNPRELVRIGTRGVSIGPADGPLAWKFFVEPRRADEAWYFLRTYAPFHLKFVQGELAFRGRGKTKPGFAEQRMLLEWARQTAAEAAGSQSTAAYGLALAWHEGGTSGNCADLVLYLTGEAVATACGVDGEVRGRLDPAHLGRVFLWFDQLRAFQAGRIHDEDPRPGALETRLIFAGRGMRQASPREQLEIEDFAAALHGELAARRRGGAAPPPASAPAAIGKPPAPAEPPAPAQRFLLPADVMKPKPLGPALQLPEKPPPVPRNTEPERQGASTSSPNPFS